MFIGWVFSCNDYGYGYSVEEEQITGNKEKRKKKEGGLIKNFDKFKKFDKWFILGYILSAGWGRFGRWSRGALLGIRHPVGLFNFSFSIALQPLSDCFPFQCLQGRLSPPFFW